MAGATPDRRPRRCPATPGWSCWTPRSPRSWPPRAPRGTWSGVVQQARRDAGLDVSDRIALTLDAPEPVLDAVRAHEAFLAGEVLASAVRVRRCRADAGRHGGRRPRCGYWSADGYRGHPRPRSSPAGPAASWHRSGRCGERTGGRRRVGGAAVRAGHSGGDPGRCAQADPWTHAPGADFTAPAERRRHPVAARRRWPCSGRRHGARRRLRRRRRGVRARPPITWVTGVDQQQDMLDRFAAAAAARGVPHRTVLGRWPDVARPAGRADVVVCHHVLHNVVDLPPFLLALTAAAAPRGGRRDARRAPDGLAGPALGAVPRPAPAAVGHRRRRRRRARASWASRPRSPLGAPGPAAAGPGLGHPAAVPARRPGARGGRGPGGAPAAAAPPPP